MPKRARTAGAPMTEDNMETLSETQMPEQRRYPGVPEIVYTIPQELYLKAQNQQTQLTDAERQLLLSRGDLTGRALAQPSLLTEEERYEVMDRPPPNIVSARIKAASSGKVSTIAELVAKATPDASGLNDAELDLIANDFHEETMGERLKAGVCRELRGPGAREAKLVWSACKELGLVEMEKTIRIARSKQFEKYLEEKNSARLAEIAAKTVPANIPEVLQGKEEERALKKEKYENLREDHAITRQINDLDMKLVLENNLTDSEKEELRRQIKQWYSQRQKNFQKSKDIEDRLYALGPPNPHKELANDLAQKKDIIVSKLVDLDKKLDAMQARDNKREEDEVRSKIDDVYAEWSVILKNHNIAQGGIFRQKVNDDKRWEKELHQQLLALQRKVLFTVIKELREIQDKMGPDDAGRDELKKKIEDKIAQRDAVQGGNGMSEAIKLHLFADSMPFPEPHLRGASKEVYFEDQKKKTQEENPELSEKEVENMLEYRWQALQIKESKLDFYKAMKANKPPEFDWNKFDWENIA